jgi:NAD(P)-dependent dehydrogenase (short-subunit alcohol dehydrogenase family)
VVVECLAWTTGHSGRSRLAAVTGSAADERVAGQAADLAQAAGSLTGWVNNAAVFRDAALDSVPIREVLDLIALNFEPVARGLRRSTSGCVA